MASRGSRFSDFRSVNLFNNLYNVPIINGCYGTPVTTGLATGTAPCTYASSPYAPPDMRRITNSPYLTYPNLAAAFIPLLLQVTL